MSHEVEKEVSLRNADHLDGKVMDFNCVVRWGGEGDSGNLRIAISHPKIRELVKFLRKPRIHNPLSVIR